VGDADSDKCHGPWMILGSDGEGWRVEEFSVRFAAEQAAERRAMDHGGSWVVVRVWGRVRSRPSWAMPTPDAAKEGA
jgi:hypothetical protein